MYLGSSQGKFDWGFVYGGFGLRFPKICVFGFVVCVAVGVSFDMGFASTWVGYVVCILVVVMLVVTIEHGW